MRWRFVIYELLTRECSESTNCFGQGFTSLGQGCSIEEGQILVAYVIKFKILSRGH